MDLSRKWLNEFVDLPLSEVGDRAFAEAMTVSGSKVEVTRDLSESIKNVVVGRIVKLEKHPNSDHMLVAQIDVDGSEGSIQIFDITSPDEPELTADVRFAQGLTEHGKMICRYGSFIDIAYGSNTWSCDPGEGPESRLEHTISFSFTYSDAENSEDSVLVYYILRPWGMRWDDVREADTGDMLYEDMMPQHYEDWYLPQLD